MMLDELVEPIMVICMGAALVRGIITAIRWVAPLPVDDAVFNTKAEGIVWARKLLGTGAAVQPEAR